MVVLRHSTLSLTKVNTYGLLFEWTGSDKSLKPVLLAAHQGAYPLVDVFALSTLPDVVPVEPITYKGLFSSSY